MNQKIEPKNIPDTQKSSEFSPDFIRVLVALAGATLLLVFVYEHGIVRSPQGLGDRMYFYPWVVAAGKTIGNGLNEFCGQSPTLFDFAERMAALLGLLFGFMIGPTLFFFGWYNRRKDRESSSMGSVLKGSAVISVVGGILTFAVALPSIPMAIIQHQVSMSIRNAQSIQTDKDQMVKDINDIAYNARQFRILPKRLDGGNGSYLGYSLPQQLAGTERGIYKVSCDVDDIIVKSVSKKYPECGIVVHIDRTGHIARWEYSGDFQ
jgi:hypothetical protein